MYPLSDNDMDRISREASEQFDVEPSTSGWDRLEKRLDKELPKEKDRRRFLWLFLLLLLVGGGLLSLQLINAGSSDQIPVVRTESPNSAPVTNNEPARDIPASATADTNTPTATQKSAGPSVTAATPAIENKKTAIAVEHSAAPVAANAGPRPSANDAPTIKVKKRAAVTGTLSSGSITKNKSAKKPVVATTDLSANNATLQIEKAANSEKAETAETETQPQTPVVTITATPAEALPAKDSTATEAAPATANATANTPKKDKGRSRNKLALGLTAGIDWSRIHSMADERNGYNFGFTISYDINDRWSVSTGAILTRKKYSALGKDFNPPDHYWTTYVKLQTVVGYCQMIDIPLNLRYNITNKKTSRLFASTGLSSYLMSRQYYKYYYINQANQAMERDWTSTENSAYWMGILNFSAGYEKQLSAHWSLQAEPFLKLPLKGVGFGRMDISSYGALFTLKYRPKF